MIKKELLVNSDPNIENHRLLHINRLPARATVIPSHKRGVYYRNKFESANVRSLNGDYRFKYLLEDSMKEFYRTDVSDGDWDTIDVPSMWQYRGYGNPEYTNTLYPIPFIPPFVKKQNPVGLYRRTFTVDKKAGRSILHFAGVDNAFYVYLNGEMVGFSKGSRLPAEFDVTDLIREGENLLAVKVFTYSDATYLENQDMLLASGIFRDVFLIETEKNTLWDFRVTTTYSSISVEAKLCVNSPYKVRFTLDGKSAEYDSAEVVKHTFELDDPRLWNAEKPELYDLNIELIDEDSAFEIHSKRVGIMHTRVSGNKFFVNEHLIYVKGVNRHENDPWNGRTMTVEQIQHDLEMIKANSLNAIRMSHYPNDPATYEIAAELGLYIMDECDLETHGAHAFNGDQGFISKSPEWYPAYEDRTVRMIERDKNEVAIFLWSTGNECGRGENLDKCAALIKKFDPTKEVICAQDPGENMPFRNFGYYPMKMAMDFPDEGYPVLAIEYAHAMGNSPGTLEDYWDYNYTHEKMLGGFVWEFRSHGFGAKDEQGNVFMKYGGDFNDIYHWVNFSMDGYCLSDGRPKPAWFELGQVSFAAYTTYADGKITVKNTNDFLTLSYLEAKYEIECDGKIIKRGELPMPEIKPHESATLEPDLTVESPISGARYYLNVLYFKDGAQVHKKQFALGVLEAAKAYMPPKKQARVTVKDYILKVEYGDFECEFVKGMIANVKKGGKLLFDKPMKLNIHRAYIDNDGIPGLFPRRIGEWEYFMLKHFYFNLFDMDVEEREDRVVVKVDGAFAVHSHYEGFLIKIQYEIFADGNVLVHIKGEPYGMIPKVLPRIGVVFEIPEEYERAHWLGRGPLENYPDSKANAPVSIYDSAVSEMNFDYDMPQETGNHEDTYALTLTTEEGDSGLSVIGSDTFAFSYHDFTLENLTDARHKNELCKSERNYLYVDYRMRGLGSHSCGPEPEEQYELHPHKFSFAFVLGSGGFADACETSRYDFGEKTRALSDSYVYTPPKKVSYIADCEL
ncbi:MAG: DUF4981 domain-containing protein [Clostridia bacterium]|nr:DUF4981 domain-containing protein [Clostridia bacterium]